jgi:hypothetical protein
MKKIILWVVVLVVLALAGFARSEVIYIGIEGEIAYIFDDLGLIQNKIQVGDTFSGYYCYDSATRNSNEGHWLGSVVGDYWHYSSPYGVYFTIGGFNFQTDPQNVSFVMEMVNDYPNYYIKDNYLIRSYNNLPIYDGVVVSGISWQLNDNTGNALSSNALLTTAPVLSDWLPQSPANISFDIDGRIVDGESFHISGIVTKAYLIPEPATVLLLGLGGMLLRRKQ